ncbi:MAG: sigma-70 family RNA polymerase sigma factor [Planctomycetaceae bacterium]|nr:sigma-70 family RNA polymerase sigma factor [Planctomycetaceae bacterium]
MEAALNTYRTLAEKNACDALIESHLSFVKKILGRMVVDLPPGVDRENLEGAGVLGLVESARRFDPQHGVPFSTFAYPRIRGAILDELRRNCPLPQEVLADWSRISQTIRQAGSPMTLKQIAQQTSLPVARVEKCLSAIRMAHPESWSDDLTPQDEREDTSSNLSREEEAARLADAMEQLTEQERIVVTLYHYKELTLRAIGEVIGLSESRVSRILAAAELRLKQLCQKHSTT